MKVGDLVRYRQGSLDMIGVFVKQLWCGDCLVHFAEKNKKIRIGPRYLEVCK